MQRKRVGFMGLHTVEPLRYKVYCFVLGPYLLGWISRVPCGPRWYDIIGDDVHDTSEWTATTWSQVEWS